MITIKNIASMGANAAQTIATRASFIRCLTGNASFRIEGYWQGTKRLDFDGFSAGLAVNLAEGLDVSKLSDTELNDHLIDNLVITNGTTVQTIALALGDGTILDNRLVGNVNITGGILSKALGEDTSDGFGTITVANGVATAIKAATTQGGKCIVQNVGSFPIAIGWTNAVTFATGIILEPKSGTANSGGSVEVSAALAIWGIASGGASDTRFLSGKFA